MTQETKDDNFGWTCIALFIVGFIWLALANGYQYKRGYDAGTWNYIGVFERSLTHSYDCKRQKDIISINEVDVHFTLSCEVFMKMFNEQNPTK